MLVHLPRVCSAILTAALLAAPLPAQAFAPGAAEIERLYNEGDRRNSEGDFKGAAESWTRLLLLLPEEGANQATRENLLLNILDAHINAYNRVVATDGKKDITNLQEGKRTFEQYLTQYRAVYGSGRAISAAVQQKSDELDAALQKADAEAKTNAGSTDVPPPKVENDTTNDKPIDPGPPVLPPENNGIGLIAGGAVTSALGLGALGVLIAGSVGAKRAEQDYEVYQANALQVCPAYPMECASQAQTDELAPIQKNLDDSDKRGKTANALTITGAVLAPVLIGAGVAMLVIGIKRNRNAKSARGSVSGSPGVGRGFAGVVLTGRF